MTGGWFGGGGGPVVGGPLVGALVGDLEGDLVGLGVGEGVGDALSDVDGLGDADVESVGDGEGDVSGTGMAPSLPSPQVSSPPTTGNALPSRVTDPAATVASRPDAAKRAAPALASCAPPLPPVSRKGGKARAAPVGSPRRRPPTGPSAPPGAIARPREDERP